MGSDNGDKTLPKNGKKCNSCSSCKLVVLFCVMLALFPVFRTLAAHDPLTYMYPNFLLFTGYREEARDWWNKNLKINRAVKRQPTHIPEIDAKDFSIDALHAATDGLRHPAVVRGFFNGAPALTKWKDAKYLAEKLGEFNIPVVRNAKYGTMQNDRVQQTFEEGVNELFEDPKSKIYMFFPVKSRFQFNATKDDHARLKQLEAATNKLVREDLELNRVWHGFGSDSHQGFFGSQMILGRGSNDTAETTGTGWHCAPGNNWFAQVVGKKRWYFMDQEHSAMMSPLRGGMVNMMTGNKKMSELADHIPLRYADIHAGDLLYNPDWEWHTIKNYEGLAIGCPIREMNITTSFRNNAQYTSIILINKILDGLKLPSIGGYPDA